MRVGAVLYGSVAYAIFFVTFLYAIGFAGDFVVPKAIDSGLPASVAASIVIDVGLLAIFAVQHSLMARPQFKTWWTSFVPAPIERSTYVLFASLALDLLFYQWHPLPVTVWEVTSSTAQILIWTVFLLGWLTVLTSTFLISHFDLFGLRQVWAYRMRHEIPPADFRTPLFYQVVRHPIYLGFILAFWATPHMTQGHLLFALATTAYVLIAIQLEERDLVAAFGAQYSDYRRRVGMLSPRIGRAAGKQPKFQ